MPTNVNYPAAAANNLIVGSGSSTDYQMMIGMDSLFNQVPGCVITSGSVNGAPSKGSQELNYACETSTGTSGTPTLGTTLEQVPGTAYLDNPINDVATEEPPMGSSNGIAQLELGRNQANTGIGTAFTTTTQQQVSAINYARSSRDPSSGNDIQGLNFVAYAKDGVAPLIWAEASSVKTSFSKAILVSGLTTAQIQGIYNGTIYDWAQLGATKSAPIFVYSAQEGSGTQATFKTFLGFDPSASTNKVNCTDPAVAGDKATATSYTPAGSKTPVTFPASTTLAGCQGPNVIFENEDSSILANASSGTESAVASAWQAENGGTAVSPVGDSIFFYSWGKFSLQCEGIKEQVTYLDKSSTKEAVKEGTDCGSEALPAGFKPDLVPVNGITASPSTILATSGSVYPIDRYLYNVYSNGSNANIPEATAATLNYVSEVGFICKPQTVGGTAEGTLPADTDGTFAADTNANDIVDPATGLWYHDEIFNQILASGFLPVNAVAGAGIGATTDGPALPNENAANATHTAYSLLSNAGYGATYLDTDAPGQTSNTSIPTGSSMPGYCILSTTDGNANS